MNDEQSNENTLTDISPENGLKTFLIRLKSFDLWKAIFLSQILSLLICGTTIINNQLNDTYGVNIPTTQSVINYFLIGLIYIPIWMYRTKLAIGETIKKNWWKYFLIILADVEANYFIIKAFSLTLITTIQVIDAFVFPITLVLSRVFLKALYKKNHIIGAISCLIGCGLLITADFLISGSQGTHRILGDIYCLASSVLYAISNVGQEALVKRNSKLEFLSFAGFFGTLISVIQMAILERQEISSFNFSSISVVSLFTGVNILMFAIYTLFPYILEITSAAFVNVNLLTSDFYAVLIGILALGYKLHYLYFIGFGLILIGTILYSLKEPTQKNQIKISNEQQVDIANKSKEQLVMV